MNKERELTKIKEQKLTMQELAIKLINLGFELFYDENSEYRQWDGTHVGEDLCIKIKNNVWNNCFIQADYYCEATKKRETVPTAEIIDNIIDKINYLYETKWKRINLIKRFYKKVLKESYYEELKMTSATIDDKIEFINSGYATELVNEEFIKKLKKVGIDNFIRSEYSDEIMYLFFTDDQWKTGKAEKYSEDGYVIYSTDLEGNVTPDSTIHECIYYLADLYNIET